MFSHKNSNQEKLNSLQSIKGDIKSKSHQSTSDQAIIEALGSYASTLTELVNGLKNDFNNNNEVFTRQEQIPPSKSRGNSKKETFTEGTTISTNDKETPIRQFIDSITHELFNFPAK